MSTLKTRANNADVKAFINSVEDEKKRSDSFKILELLREVSGENPIMWGGSIVGFGTYHYKYASGREGEWMACGFSPRKQALTLYIMSGFSKYDSLLQKLGKFKTGKSCLYIKKLEDINESILRELIASSIDYIKKKYN